MIPPVPYAIRLAISTALYLVAFALSVVGDWVTPERSEKGSKATR